jgi:gliding motility-associated-like protein
MKKNYLFIAIFFSIFSFTTSASTFEIKNGIVLKGASSHSNTNPKKLLFRPYEISLAAPITNPTASSTTLCQGETLTLTANPSGGVAPYTYSWTGPNGYVSTDENPVINNIGLLAAGVYSLVVTDFTNATSTIQSTTAIVINSKIDPEFEATLPAICRGGFAPILSTTSTNGITGTWNPAIVNNANTTTYFFTPDPGQCANSLAFTIFVLTNVAPKFTLPSSICKNETPPILPSVSNNGIVGTWNPSVVSNTVSGTYSFTPSAGQCATNTTVTININPLSAVFLPAIPPMCSGDFLAPLPTTSTNGVTGTWSPAVNNTTTTTYIFTPSAGQCASVQTSMTIVVNPITPVFSQVAPICSGAVLAPLPTTSTNGVTGTWSPAINNTATTTYTFTPTIGQCSVSPVTMTIVVNPISAVFSQVAPICLGQTLTPLPTTSTNGVTGTWAPAINNTATTTYTFTPTVGQCATTPVTMTIVVNPITATFTQVAPICLGQTLTPLPTTSTNGVTGTWSPSINNIASTTYTFTPTVGQCSVSPVTMTIVVNPITAVFTQVAPICSGAVLAPLPTTSTNGVTGTWSPAVNNTVTTTYTFTPTLGQCSVSPVTMTIVVNPITATFTQVAPICSGAVLAPLPTTSNNGVTGTWSPAVNNTATTTYTFTPTAGQCSVSPVTMTIVVNPITAVFTQVAPICSGAVLAPLPTTSTNGVTGTWSPAVNNTVTTTYTFTPTLGQCSVSPVTMTIVVNPIKPVFSQVAPICSGQTLVPLPTTSNNGINGTWSPSINNIATTTYTFTPTVGQCATTPVTMTIAVNPITATFTQVAPICSGQTLTPLPTTSTNGVTGTWSPALNNTATTTYTFTTTVGQCATTPVTMTIVVNPITPVFSQVAPICLGGVLAPLPTTSTNGVTGTWSPSINNTATTTYTFTPTIGQCATTPVTMTIAVNPITATFTQVAPICSGQTLTPLPNTSTNGVTGTWSPAMNNAATTTYTFTPTVGQCSVNPVTMTIVVNPITAVFTPVVPICSGGVLAPLPTTSNNGVNGTWSPAINNTATTTYIFTPTAGQCATTPVTMTIVVNLNIVPTFTAIAPFCSGSASPVLPTISNNLISGTWNPALVSNSISATYTFTPTTGQCATTTTLDVTVTPKTVPLFVPIADFCYGSTPPTLPATSTNGITGTWNPAVVNNTASTIYTFTPTPGICATTLTLTINVTTITPQFNAIAPLCANTTAPLLSSTSTNGITGIWNPAIVSNTASGNYIFTPDAGQCATTTTLNVTVNQNVTPTFTPITPICSGIVSPVLPLTSNNSIVGTWNPATVSNTISGIYTFTPTAGQCATPTTLNVTVNPNVTPTFALIAPLCLGEVSPILPLKSSNGVSGTWNPATISNTLSGNYIFTPNAGQCALTMTLSIIVNPSPTSITLKTTDVINERPDGIIEITGVTSGLGPFKYSINNNSFTSNTIYSNLIPGDYTIMVQDSNGCVFSKVTKINSICLIPNVITPNNDTFNDTFNLNGCEVLKLQIFNRYGVEVNKFDNYSDQWNGTNRKGESLPDGTYFYVAEIKDGTSKSGWVFVTK